MKENRVATRSGVVFQGILLELITLNVLRFDIRNANSSLVVQLVKNPPAMLETWVQSLGWEDPLEKGKATTDSSILAWRIPRTV